MQVVPASGSDEERGEQSDSGSAARAVFVAASAAVLIAFVLLQVVVNANQGGGAAQAKKLMSQIRAEVVEAPLTAAQLEWPLETGEGRTITLAQLPRDRLIFLNFWATWCPLFRDELPSMFRLRQTSGRSTGSFAMVAVELRRGLGRHPRRSSPEVGRPAAPRTQQMYLVKDTKLEDPGHTLRETFGTTQIPDSYVILNGRVLARFVNARNWTDPSIIEYFEKLAPELASEGGR